MENNELISIREFARRLGVSDTSIHKAIKAGKIVKGLDRKDKRKPIIYEIAFYELKGSYAPTKIQNEKLDKVMNSEPTKKTKHETIKKIDVPHDDTEPTSDDISDADGKLIIISNRAAYNEAKRVEAIIKARTAQLEHEKLKGSLVNKNDVYKSLFALGQEVRAAVQGIPDKYLDLVLASSSRSEAHEILSNAITECLESLTKKIEL